MILKLILLFALVHSLKCEDFCEAQKKCYSGCKQCSKYEIQNNTQYVLQEMTDGIRSLILHEMNTFRNDVALGGKYSLLLPEAANMRPMHWDFDLEYFMALEAMNDRKCLDSAVTYRTGWQAYYYNPNGVYTPEISIRNAMAVIFGMVADTKKNRIAWSMSNNFMANNTRIGCAFATYVDILENTSLYMTCATATRSVDRLIDAYEVGPVCSKCSTVVEQCGSKYVGLCNI